MIFTGQDDPEIGTSTIPTQTFAKACSNTGSQQCDHESMLRKVKAPVLLTHHYRRVDLESGGLAGAISNLQAEHVRRLVEGGGSGFTYKSFLMPLSMHGHDPACYVAMVTASLEERGLGKALTPSTDQQATTA